MGNCPGVITTPARMRSCWRAAVCIMQAMPAGCERTSAAKAILWVEPCSHYSDVRLTSTLRSKGRPAQLPAPHNIALGISVVLLPTLAAVYQAHMLPGNPSHMPEQSTDTACYKAESFSCTVSCCNSRHDSVCHALQRQQSSHTLRLCHVQMRAGQS